MRPSRLSPLLAAVFLSPGAVDANATEWSHILGPSLDRKTADGTAAWSSGTPRKVWQIAAEGGFSSFVTGDGRAYTVIATKGGEGTRETAMAVDRKTGKTLWHFPTNVRMKASPMTFTYRGNQYIVVAAGPNILCFGL